MADPKIIDTVAAQRFARERERLAKAEATARRTAGFNDAMARLFGVDRGEARAIAEDIDARRKARDAEDLQLAKNLRGIEDELAKLDKDQMEYVKQLTEDFNKIAMDAAGELGKLDVQRMESSAQTQAINQRRDKAMLDYYTQSQERLQGRLPNDALDAAATLDTLVDKLDTPEGAARALRAMNTFMKGAYSAEELADRTALLYTKTGQDPLALAQKAKQTLSSPGTAGQPLGIIDIGSGEGQTAEGLLTTAGVVEDKLLMGAQFIDDRQTQLAGDSSVDNAQQVALMQKKAEEIARKAAGGIKPSPELVAYFVEIMKDPSKINDVDKMRDIASKVYQQMDPRRSALEARKTAIQDIMRQERAPITSGEAGTLEQLALRGSMGTARERQLAALPTAAGVPSNASEAATAEEKPPTAQDTAGMAAQTAAPKKKDKTALGTIGAGIYEDELDE